MCGRERERESERERERERDRDRDRDREREGGLRAVWAQELGSKACPKRIGDFVNHIGRGTGWANTRH